MALVYRVFVNFFHLNKNPSLSADAEDVFDGLCLQALDAQDVSA